MKGDAWFPDGGYVALTKRGGVWYAALSGRDTKPTGFKRLSDVAREIEISHTAAELFEALTEVRQ